MEEMIDAGIDCVAEETPMVYVSAAEENNPENGKGHSYSFSIEERINGALSEVRHFLQEDGGDVEFVRFEYETGVAEIRLLGACKTCPMYLMTLRGGIERFLLTAVKEIARVEAVR